MQLKYPEAQKKQFSNVPPIVPVNFDSIRAFERICYRPWPCFILATAGGSEDNAPIFPTGGIPRKGRTADH